MKKSTKKKVRPAQKIKRSQKGKSKKMKPLPVVEHDKSFFRLQGKVAILTGADSGIGKAIAIAFAKEGASVVINYDFDDVDARATQQRVESIGAKCLLMKGDISSEAFCKKLVTQTIRTFNAIDIIINNAGVQFPQKKLEAISKSQMKRTFEVNVFGQLYLVKAAEPYLQPGASIIHTTSVTAYRGSHHLIDYASTKGAIVSLVRSLALYFAPHKIRVNGVAPGPVWTPLIPSTFTKEEVAKFGSDCPLGRAGEPYEIAYAYTFLASDESSYITGQVIHPNGGEIINT